MYRPRRSPHPPGSSRSNGSRFRLSVGVLALCAVVTGCTSLQPMSLEQPIEEEALLREHVRVTLHSGEVHNLFVERIELPHVHGLEHGNLVSFHLDEIQLLEVPRFSWSASGGCLGLSAAAAVGSLAVAVLILEVLLGGLL